MNTPLTRAALTFGVIIGIVNTAFAAAQYGFGGLPLWFYLVQLLLIPAMLLPLRLFPQAQQAPQFLRRVGLYAMGWAVPYIIYKTSSDALNPSFDPAATFISYLVSLTLFSVIFSAINKPQSKK